MKISTFVETKQIKHIMRSSAILPLYSYIWPLLLGILCYCQYISLGIVRGMHTWVFIASLCCGASVGQHVASRNFNDIRVHT